MRDWEWVDRKREEADVAYLAALKLIKEQLSLGRITRKQFDIINGNLCDAKLTAKESAEREVVRANG